jgi:hypothetical protein
MRKNVEVQWEAGTVTVSVKLEKLGEFIQKIHLHPKVGRIVTSWVTMEDEPILPDGFSMEDFCSYYLGESNTTRVPTKEVKASTERPKNSLSYDEWQKGWK